LTLLSEPLAVSVIHKLDGRGTGVMDGMVLESRDVSRLVWLQT